MSRRRKKDHTSQTDDTSGTQDSPTRERPSRVFLSEGYSVSCWLDRIEIQTIDYHAGVLRFTWPELERLMVESGWVPPTEEADPQTHSEN